MARLLQLIVFSIDAGNREACAGHSSVADCSQASLERRTSSLEARGTSAGRLQRLQHHRTLGRHPDAAAGPIRDRTQARLSKVWITPHYLHASPPEPEPTSSILINIISSAELCRAVVKSQLRLASHVSSACVGVSAVPCPLTQRKNSRLLCKQATPQSQLCARIKPPILRHGIALVPDGA